MSTKLFVGNLPWSSTEQDLEAHFGQFGTLEEVYLPMDRDTGRPRGFGFVTFADGVNVDSVIDATHGKDFNGRPLTVNVAKPRRDEN